MKILLFDIETAPSLAYMWSLWKEIMSMTFVEEDWFILCWGAKWLGEKEVISSALPDFKQYKKNKRDDRLILKKLWKLLDDADVVITHNGIKFDHKKVNARFLMNGMTPPSPYRTIDTLAVARNQFAFTSNKLGDLAKFLGLGQKTDTGGFELWRDCIEGKLKAWKTMVKYCKHDVDLLEEVYLEMRPYMHHHPNMSIYSEDVTKCCPKCGSEDLHYRGYYYTNMQKFHRFVCNDCGGWGRDRSNQLDKEKRKTITTNAG